MPLKLIICPKCKNANENERCSCTTKSMNEPELFDVSVVKSPRLKWMEKNHVRTKFYPGVEEGDEDPETGKDLHPWVAWKYEGKVYPPSDARGGGTQNDALAAWARAAVVKMWNEEGL